MPVDDFLAAALDTSPVLEMARGNGGVVNDIQTLDKAIHEFFLVIPTVGQVTLGVNYGQQGTELVGTASGGGGPTYYAF